VRDGTAIVDIRVQADGQQLGHGLTGSVLIPLDRAAGSAARWQKTPAES
jgi:hypothetical protein